MLINGGTVEQTDMAGVICTILLLLVAKEPKIYEDGN
jgi:hypothetical protein